MNYQPRRDEKEDCIRMLAHQYPKCFFTDPRMRRPLKKSIVADLQIDGFQAARELIVAAVDWYQSHIGYLLTLQAGVRRIDLQGKEVGTVTEQEYLVAQKEAKENRDRERERRAMLSAVTVNASLYNTGRIPYDQLKKLDAPPLPKAPPLPSKEPVAAELTRVYEALVAASATLTGNGDADLRRAMTSAALGIVIKEAQRLIDSA